MVKQSINIPPWLREQVRQACPDVPFGSAARDALIIALPVWRAQQGGRLEAELKAQMRLLKAASDAQAAGQPKGARPSKARPARKSARQAPAPGARPTHRRDSGKTSAAKGGSVLPGDRQHKR